MHFELVVFDMAGTTVVDDNAVNDCFRGTLRAANVSVTRAEVDSVMGMAKPAAIRALLARHPDGLQFSDDDAARIHDAFVANMIHHYETAPGVREVFGTSRTFLRLRAMGIKVALDTGFSRPIVEVILDRLGWESKGLVDASVTSDEVRRGRPHPDMIFEAMRRTHTTNVGRVIKVGDTPSDLQEGAAAGCPVVVGVTNGTHTEEQLRRYPCTFVVPSVALLPELLRRVESWPRATLALS